MRYYESVAEWMLPHLKDRPVSLVRAPDGIGGELFFQKHAARRSMPGHARARPGAVARPRGAARRSTRARRCVAAAQMNVDRVPHLELDRRKHIDKPDRMIFDLDPGEGVTWPHVQEAALLMRALLDELGLQSLAEDQRRQGPARRRAARAAARLRHGQGLLAGGRPAPGADDPGSASSPRAAPANRVGKIFIDYLRNGHGATTAAAFSARARPGLGVSMPVAGRS